MEPQTRKYQKAFASYLRDPSTAALPEGAPKDRMDVYAELFFNATEGIVAQCFPITREWLGGEKWNDMVRRFYAGHVSTTPYFREIPREFMEWLSTTAQHDIPPFLPPLVHWEWVELVVETMDAEVQKSPAPEGDLLDFHPRVNPTLMVAAYDWPVHQIRPDDREVAPAHTVLASYRRPDHDVEFIELTPMLGRFIELLQGASLSARGALGALADEIGFEDRAQLMTFGRDTIHQLYEQDALLGFDTSTKGDPQ